MARLEWIRPSAMGLESYRLLDRTCACAVETIASQSAWICLNCALVTTNSGRRAPQIVDQNWKYFAAPSLSTISNTSHMSSRSSFRLACDALNHLSLTFLVASF